METNDRFTLNVQITLPVEDPVNNVRCSISKSGYSLEIPHNYPDLHNLTYAQLVHMALDIRARDFFTALNNKK